LYSVWKYKVVALLAVADPVNKVTSPVVNAAKVPFEAVLHLRSAAGLLVRAGAPGEVFVAVHVAAAARRLSVHDALALTVSVGPVVALKPASKSAGVGAVNGVDAAGICSLTTRPAVMDTVPGMPQLSGAPLAWHCCADAPDADAVNPITAAIIAAPNLMRLISSPVQL
jgi:glyoxylate carboligase